VKVRKETLVMVYVFEVTNLPFPMMVAQSKPGVTSRNQLKGL